MGVLQLVMSAQASAFPLGPHPTEAVALPELQICVLGHLSVKNQPSYFAHVSNKPKASTF